MAEYTSIRVASHSYTVYSERSDEEWGSWATELESGVDGVYLPDTSDRRGSYGDEFPVNPVKEGDTVYVLYAIYSDGDSFGRCEGKLDILWAFTDRRLAKEAELRLKFANGQHGKGWDVHKDHSVSFFVENARDRMVTLSNNGADYFCGGYTIYLDSFVVRA